MYVCMYVYTNMFVWMYVYVSMLVTDRQAGRQTSRHTDGRTACLPTMRPFLQTAGLPLVTLIVLTHTDPGGGQMLGGGGGATSQSKSDP